MKYLLSAKKILLSALVTAALLAIPLATASAQFNFPGGGGGPRGGLDELKRTSGNNIPDPVGNVNSRSDVIALIAKVIEWALYLSGAVAVVFVIIGGYRYLTAGGNEETATKARKAVVNALIGLVIIILAYVIVNVPTNFVTNS